MIVLDCCSPATQLSCYLKKYRFSPSISVTYGPNTFSRDCVREAALALHEYETCGEQILYLTEDHVFEKTGINLFFHPPFPSFSFVRCHMFFSS